MKYIIADPDEQVRIDLKEILDGYQILDFQGSFTTLAVAERCIRREPPDIAFIRMGKAELNAYQLSSVISTVNPFSKIIFLSNHEGYAVEAFESEADGFLLVPFNREQIKHLLFRLIEKRRA